MLQAIAGSIRYKFALVALATTLAALAVAGSALLAYEWRNYREQGVRDLTTQAAILGRASAPALAFDDHMAAQENLALLNSRPGVLAGALYNARGRKVAEYRAAGRPSLAVPELPEAEGWKIEGDEMAAFARIVENREIVGTVYLRASYGVRDRLAGLLGILAAVSVLSLLAAGVIAMWLQSALTRPIRAIAATAREVMQRRDFSLRVRKSTSDELGTLADAFNDMLAELGRRAEALQATNRSLEHEAAQREHAEQQLREINAQLEARVLERTAQLEAANKELEGFSYSVSHDLRAPLRWVVGFSEALVEDHGPELSEEARRKVGIIRDEGRRMGQLIDDLLAFSRLGRKPLQQVDCDVAALVRNVWKTLSEQQDTSRVDLQLGQIPSTRGDRALLTQVWTNLLANAVKFSAKRERPRIDINSITDASEHIYFVRDNGAGFNPKYQAKLFGVFQRLHDSGEFPGTGVGLALVQRIVTRHGGRVWAEGRPDEGATFYFSLPKDKSDG